MSITHVSRYVSVVLMGTSICLEANSAQEGRFSPDPSPNETRPSQHRVPSRPQMSPVTQVLPARFRATVYELQTDRVDTLTPDALVGQAATSESLLKALRGFGSARVLYQVDQFVNAASEQILIGSGEPLRLGSNEDADQSFTGVTYINVGLILQLAAETTRAGQTGENPEVSLKAQLSTLGREQPPPRNKSAAIRAVKFAEAEPLEFNRPRVALGTNSNPATAQTQPMAYIIRYVFDELRPSPANADLHVQPVVGSEVARTNSGVAPFEFPALFRATAYEVKINPDHLLELDGDSLRREATTAEKLLARLAEIGEARITYSISQVVNVLSDNAIFSTNKMLVTGVRSASGPTGPRPIFSKAAHNFGFSARFAGAWPTQNSATPNVTLLIQSSGLVPGVAPLTPEFKADGTYVRSITHSELLEFGKPRVILSVVSADESSPATVSVFRYLFSPPPEK